MGPVRIELTYDIVFGPVYRLVPLYSQEIIPTGVIQEIHSAQAKNTLRDFGKKK